MGTLKYKMVEEEFKKKLEGNKYAGYVKIGEKIEKGSDKIGKSLSKNKMSYNSGNPLKKLLKADRPTVKINKEKTSINLMKAQW
jgi:hypothetical protein